MAYNSPPKKPTLTVNASGSGDMPHNELVPGVEVPASCARARSRTVSHSPQGSRMRLAPQMRA